MDSETLFFICNNMVVPGWLLLMVAPRWRWTRRIIYSFIIPFILGLIYFYLIITEIGSTEGSFMTLEGVAKLFQNKNLLLAGWIHYLAFDLFVGSWEVMDSQKCKISHFWVIPCLILTFMFGPIGLVLYLIIKWSTTKIFLDDNRNKKDRK